MKMKVPVICMEERIEVGHLNVEAVAGERVTLTSSFILQNYFPNGASYSFKARPAEGTMLQCPRCLFTLCIRGDHKLKDAQSIQADVLIPIVTGATAVALLPAEDSGVAR